MPNPIQELIAEAPVAATFNVPAVEPAYSPDAHYSPAERPPAPPAVYCRFREAKEEGVAQDHKAIATFSIEDCPADLKEKTITVTIMDQPYGIAAMRKRVWEGVHIGWTLYLS